MTKQEFAQRYNEKRFSWTGAIASEAEIDENYRDYQALVELTGRDGELNFSRRGTKGLAWNFSPTRQT